MTGNPMEYSFSLVFPIFFYLVSLVLLAYFVVSAIRFFKHKDINDKELLQKVDVLMKWHTQQSDKKSIK